MIATYPILWYLVNDSRHEDYIKHTWCILAGIFWFCTSGTSSRQHSCCDSMSWPHPLGHPSERLHWQHQWGGRLTDRPTYWLTDLLAAWLMIHSFIYSFIVWLGRVLCFVHWNIHLILNWFLILKLIYSREYTRWRNLCIVQRDVSRDQHRHWLGYEHTYQYNQSESPHAFAPKSGANHARVACAFTFLCGHA